VTLHRRLLKLEAAEPPAPVSPPPPDHPFWGDDPREAAVFIGQMVGHGETTWGRVREVLPGLRCDGQLGGLIEVPLGGSAALAEVALSPQPHALAVLGPFPPPAPALPAGRRAHRAFGLQARSEPVI
jgi:hypothetical protein